MNRRQHNRNRWKVRREKTVARLWKELPYTMVKSAQFLMKENPVFAKLINREFGQ